MNVTKLVRHLMLAFSIVNIKAYLGLQRSDNLNTVYVGFESAFVECHPESPGLLWVYLVLASFFFVIQSIHFAIIIFHFAVSVFFSFYCCPQFQSMYFNFLVRNKFLYFQEFVNAIYLETVKWDIDVILLSIDHILLMVYFLGSLVQYWIIYF